MSSKFAGAISKFLNFKTVVLGETLWYRFPNEPNFSFFFLNQSIHTDTFYSTYQRVENVLTGIM